MSAGHWRTTRTATQPSPAPPPISPDTARAQHGERDKVMRGCRWLACFAALTAAGGMLASCGTPVGVSPALQGTYWERALVTNPSGTGPQVVRWGPPQNDTPRADE